MFKKFPLQLKIFLPMGMLILAAHAMIYFHISRVLETDKIFESIIVSILQRNIIGTGMIVLMICFGIASIIAHKILRDSADYRAAQEVMQDLELDSLDLDFEDLENSSTENNEVPGFNTDDLELAQEFMINKTLEIGFTDKLSRDLIHPLAAILGHTQLAKMKNPSEEIGKNLELIETEARRVKNLIEEFISKGDISSDFLGQGSKVIPAKPRAPRIRAQSKIRLGNILVENFGKFPQPMERIEIPALAPFPEISNLALESKFSVRRPGLGHQTSLEVSK